MRWWRSGMRRWRRARQWACHGRRHGAPLQQANTVLDHAGMGSSPCVCAAPAAGATIAAHAAVHAARRGRLPLDRSAPSCIMPGPNRARGVRGGSLSMAPPSRPLGGGRLNAAAPHGQVCRAPRAPPAFVEQALRRRQRDRIQCRSAPAFRASATGTIPGSAVHAAASAGPAGGASRRPCPWRWISRPRRASRRLRRP